MSSKTLKTSVVIFVFQFKVRSLFNLDTIRVFNLIKFSVTTLRRDLILFILQNEYLKVMLQKSNESQ